MPNKISAELNFHQQDEVSIFEESTLNQPDEALYELYLFISYTLRQMSNLGIHQVTDTLANALMEAPTQIGVVASGVPFGGFRIVPYPGAAGRKRFLTSLMDNNRGAKFELKMIGFGILGRGMGYYAPTSVLALLAFFARKRRSDPQFVHMLAHSAMLCGQAQLGRIIGVGNQPAVAEQILGTICGAIST
jgi:hypothetical protein